MAGDRDAARRAGAYAASAGAVAVLGGTAGLLGDEAEAEGCTAGVNVIIGLLSQVLW